MFSNIKEIFFCCSASIVGLVALGFGMKINKFETNFLHIDNDYQIKMFLSKNSYQKSKYFVGKTFKYLENGREYKRLITSISLVNNNTYVVTFENDEKVSDKKLIEISYFLEKKNFWSNLFE